MNRGTFSLAIVLAVLASSAGAASADDPPPRRFEVGGFVGLDYFGDDIELGNSWAAEQIPGTGLLLGGRAGFVLLPDLLRGRDADLAAGIEGEAKLAFSSTGEVAEGGRDSYFAPVLGWRVQGILRLTTDFVLAPHLVVGVGGESVLTSSPFMVDDTDSTFLWGPGASWALTDRLDARVDFRHGLTAGRQDFIVSTFELQFGLVYGWDLHQERLPPPPPSPPPPPPEEPEEPEEEPVLDPDADGLVGEQDACPTEAEDFDKFQDEDGCPDLDNDNDTIPDVSDACPGEPETWNGFDDTDGCPDELPRVLKEFTGAIEGITFEYGKARIRPASRKALDKATATLREYASIRLRIEGHTDDRGKREANMALSLKRADAVKWYLIDKGIAADRIETVGHGPDKPVGSNKTNKGRAQNRRIEFHIVFQDPSANVAPEAPQTQPAAPQTQPAAPQTQPTTP